MRSKPLEIEKTFYLCDNINSYMKFIDIIDARIRSCKTKEEYTEELLELYRFVKEITPSFYIDGKIDESYKDIIYGVRKCESHLSRKFIMESSPQRIQDLELTSSSSKESILDYIVGETRRTLSILHSGGNFNSAPLTNFGYTSSLEVHSLCEKAGIEDKMVCISPGYAEELNLFDGSHFHYVNILCIEGTYYLVDCTYRQFFTSNNNSLERLGIVSLGGCSVGTFMKMDGLRLNVAKTVLSRGWIKLDESTYKAYFDGFTMSFRNGLYYEETDDYTFMPKYSAYDYINFLVGTDNQVNYEGTEVLGYQLRPLKKNLKFGSDNIG